MSDITRLLDAIRADESEAAQRLLTVVYDELRRLAAKQMIHEAANRTLSPTELVHEAFLRLVGSDGQRQLTFENRRHFFGAAAQAMQRILVEAARKRGRKKRGADWQRKDLTDIAVTEEDARLIALDEALDNFAKLDPVSAEVVRLHRFVGLPLTEVANILGMTKEEIEKKWRFAKAWLRDAVKESD